MPSLKYEKKKITLPMPRSSKSTLPIVLTAILTIGLMACDSDPGMPVSDTQYFPLRVGDYRVYHVSETQVSAYNIETDFEYDLKTVVVDSFVNVTGTYSYVMHRFKRESSLHGWESLDAWTARADDREVVVTEGSTPFVRLTFPMKNGRNWNGNAYNNLESSEFCEGDSFTSCDLYQLENVSQPLTTTLEQLFFENTVEVIQNNSPDLITKYDIRKEVYASGVGLVYKHSTILNYCTIGNCLGQQLVEAGVIFTQELIAYGHE
jgi:hypothetical protein